MSSHWQPINENHAISVMAAFVRFEDALPDLLIRQIAKRLGPEAEALGLKSVKSAQRVQFQISAEGMSSAAGAA